MPFPEVKIVNGDALATLRCMRSNSVHCVVTSPPYFGLRDYGVAGQVGLEQTPQQYVEKLVEIFREVRRVLRDDGTCWLNLGDSYARAPTKGGSGPNGKNEYRWGYGEANKQRVKNPNSKQATNRSADLDGVVRNEPGLGNKQLLGIPWRVAFALQSDGWYLRQDIIWHKPNPMPESVRDRCTKAHEYLFLLTKSEKYYFDADAIKENSITNDARRPYTSQGAKDLDGREKWKSGEKRDGEEFNKRNKRSVWTIAPKPYKEAHFATFPPALVEPCVKAGTSEHGCCPACGAPHTRVVERKAMVIDRSGRTHEKGRTRSSGTMVEPAQTITTDWQQSCKCPALPPLPCIVMDIFGGAGTTGVAAQDLNRRCVLIELNPSYVNLIEKRLEQQR